MSIIRSNGGNRSSNLLPSSSLFQDFFNSNWPTLNFWDRDANNDNWLPASNVKESDTQFTVELSVAGYAKKDINVKVENNMLQVSGKHEEKKDDSSENYTRREFSYGSFNRSFSLPENVNQDGVKASCENGVLTITLPKKEESKVKTAKKDIAIS